MKTQKRTIPVFLFIFSCLVISACSNLEDEKLTEFRNQVAEIKITAYDTVFSTISKTQTLKIFPEFLNGFGQEVFLEETPKQLLYINDEVSRDFIIDSSEETEYAVYLKIGNLKSNTLKIKVMDVSPTKYISRIEVNMGDSTFAPYAINGVSKVDLNARIYDYQGREFTPTNYPKFSIWFDGVEYQNPRDIPIERSGTIPFYAISGENKSEVKYIISREKPDLSRVYSLPVIFHLVGRPNSYQFKSEEIPGILEKTNAHFRNEQRPFRKSHNAVESGIQFTLALTDTLGNLLEEPGIHRIETDVIVFPFNSDLTNKFVFEHLWDPEKYVNVFIMDLTKAGGFANYPREYPADQVPPLNFNYMAAVDPTSSNKSLTLTHELGHFLGLRHIFNLDENYPCEDGDGFPDTESYLRNKDLFTYHLPIFCNGIPFFSTNQMDYVGVRNSFTLDQVLKMREVVAKNIYLPAIDSKGRVEPGPFVKGTLDLTVKAIE